MLYYLFKLCCPIKSSYRFVTINECPICLETKQLVRLKKCKHDFCVDCLEQWFITSFDGTPTCPICREKVKFNKKRFVNYYSIEVI